MLMSLASISYQLTPDDEEWLDCAGRDFDLDADCTAYWQCFEGKQHIYINYSSNQSVRMAIHYNWNLVLLLDNRPKR